MNPLGFAAPVWLVALILLLPLAVWFVARAERRRARGLAAFGEPQVLARSSALARPRDRRLGAALRLGALTLAGIALARPQLGDRPAAIAREGRDVLVLLDLSRSMTVPDVKPTRLAAAKRAALEAVAASPNDRLGLVVFGGSAFLQLPLTADRAAFRLFLESAKPGDLGDPSTDVSSALATAARTFAHEGERGYQAAVLVSDGESGESDMDRALAALKKQEVPVFAIGVGTSEGAPVPADSSEAPEPYHRDHIGRIVVSRLEEGDLRRAARETGGLYARAANPDEMRALAQGLSRLDVHALAVTKARRHADRFQWPLALALAVLAIEPLARRRRRGAAGRAPALAAAALAALVVAACATASREARRGERLYDDGRWADAHQAFERAHAKSEDPALAYDAANALYRLKHYPQAIKAYRDVSGGAPELRARTLFNLGNAAVRAAEDADPGDKDALFAQAIAAYEAVLRADPSNTDAKWNLEVALRKRGDTPTGSSSGRGRRGDYGRGAQNVPGFTGTPQAAVGAMAGGGYGSGEGESAEELNESQARQLLDAVQREQLSSHFGRPARRPTRDERDW
ncbi:MAG TPA: VWA domain-containing protein [Gemmatimonadales bacterium]|nr:VWA domain-containing protein [Gemmatimonadales bacterium]